MNSESAYLEDVCVREKETKRNSECVRERGKIRKRIKEAVS